MSELNNLKNGCTLDEEVCPHPDRSCTICGYYEDYHKGKKEIRVGKSNGIKHKRSISDPQQSPKSKITFR